MACYVLQRQMSRYTSPDLVLGVFSSHILATRARRLYMQHIAGNGDPYDKQAYKTVNLDEDLSVIKVPCDMDAIDEQTGRLFLLARVLDGMGVVVQTVTSAHSNRTGMEAQQRREHSEGALCQMEHHVAAVVDLDALTVLPVGFTTLPIGKEGAAVAMTTSDNIRMVRSTLWDLRDGLRELRLHDAVFVSYGDDDVMFSDTPQVLRGVLALCENLDTCHGADRAVRRRILSRALPLALATERLGADFVSAAQHVRRLAVCSNAYVDEQ